MSKKIVIAFLFVALLFFSIGIAVGYFFYKNKEFFQSDEVEVVVSNVGVLAPITGEGATYGASMKRGFDLAFSSAPTISLKYEDTKFDAKLAVTEFNKLITVDKVKVVLGEAASGVTMALAPLAEKNKVILFSTISSTDSLKTAGDYFFRNVPRNEIQGRTAAEFLFNKLNIKTAGLFGENDEYGINLSKSFKERFIELGGQIKFEDAYASASKDYKTALSKAKSAGVDALFIPGNYQESAQILKQAKELGLNIPLIGGDGSYSPEIIKIAGTSTEGFYCTIMAVNKSTEYYKKFHELFLAKYNQEPDVYDAYAYEGAMIILEAIQKSGNDADKVKEYLYTHTFQSMTVELKFDSDGEVQRLYGLNKIINSKFETVE